MEKKITYCDVCGKQMTQFDSDGYPIQVGYKLFPETRSINISVGLTEKTNVGTSSRNIISLVGRDFCCKECLKSALSSLLTELNVR